MGGRIHQGGASVLIPAVHRQAQTYGGLRHGSIALMCRPAEQVPAMIMSQRNIYLPLQQRVQDAVAIVGPCADAQWRIAVLIRLVYIRPSGNERLRDPRM